MLICNLMKYVKLNYKGFFGGNMILTRRGLSIIEVLIAMSMMIILSFSASQLIMNQLKSQKVLEQKLEKADLQQSITTYLGQLDSCGCSFKDIEIGSPTETAPTTVDLTSKGFSIGCGSLKTTLIPGASTGEAQLPGSQTGLTLNSIKIKNIIPAGVSTTSQPLFSGNLEISLGGAIIPLRPINRMLTFIAEGGKIVGCETSTSGAASLNGLCGSASGATIAYSSENSPVINLCSAGESTMVATTSTCPYGIKAPCFTWSCLGKNGGVDSPICAAPKQVTGVCGSQSSTGSPPSGANACSVGSVYGMINNLAGSWNWSCAGINGGAQSSLCSAAGAPIAASTSTSQTSVDTKSSSTVTCAAQTIDYSVSGPDSCPKTIKVNVPSMLAGGATFTFDPTTYNSGKCNFNPSNPGKVDCYDNKGTGTLWYPTSVSILGLCDYVEWSKIDWKKIYGSPSYTGIAGNDAPVNGCSKNGNYIYFDDGSKSPFVGPEAIGKEITVTCSSGKLNSVSGETKCNAISKIKGSISLKCVKYYPSMADGPGNGAWVITSNTCSY